MFRGPAHIREQIAHPRALGRADKPVAAIIRRTEDQLIPAQRIEGGRDVAAIDVWNIAADDGAGYGPNPVRQFAIR